MKKYVIPVVVILILAAVAGVCLLSGGSDSPLRGAAEAKNADSKDTVLTAPELPAAVTGEQSGIRIVGYPEISVPADKTEVNLNLMNPEGNPCTFTFCLTLQDTGEVLYTSEAVKPGDYIGTAVLSRALSAGEYEANIHIATNSLTDGSPMNDANLATKLIAK